MIAMLLLGTIFAALPGAQALAVAVFSVAPAGHPAGCHSHRPATPTPAPASYQCCVNRHVAALPNASFTSRPLEARICGLAFASRLLLGSAFNLDSVILVVPSSSPPFAAPLRI